MNASFRYPLDPQPRTFTLLEAGPWRPGDAETAVIAAKLLHRAWSDLWTPMLQIVILTGPRYGMLTEDDRHLIWRRWGVPVYEFLTDATGTLVASECDAHEGLHVRVPGILGEERECGCGVTGRMLPIGVAADAQAA